MKRLILIVSVASVIAVGSGLWLSQSLQPKDANSLVRAQSAPTQAPALSSLPPLEDPKVTAARYAKERQEAIERENNPRLPDGLPKTGAGLKRMKKFASVEVSPQFLTSWIGSARTGNAKFSRDGKLLLLGSNGTDVYRTSDWSLVRTMGGHDGADLSPDARLVAAWVEEGVAIWRLRDGQRLKLLNDKSGIVSKVGVWGPVAFSPDGRRLVTLGEDPNTKWTPDGGYPGAAITEAAFNRQIAMKVWDVSSGKRLKVIVGPWTSAYSNSKPVAWVRTSTRKNGKFEPRSFYRGDGICQLPNRTLSVRIHWEGYLSVEDLTTKQLIRNIPFGDGIGAAALSPNGALVASGGDGRNNGSDSPLGVIKIWRVADGKLLAKFEGKGHKTGAIAFAPDGKKLIVVGRGDKSSDITAVYAL